MPRIVDYRLIRRATYPLYDNKMIRSHPIQVKG